MELLPAHFTIESMVKKFKDKHALALKETLHSMFKSKGIAFCLLQRVQHAFVLTVKVLFSVLFFVLVEFSVIKVQESAPKEVCSWTALEERSCYPMC